MGCSFASDAVCSEKDSPEHPATVDSFALDTFEVTVGRFRKFVDLYEGPPTEGAGAHPLIAGSGWKSSWDGSMPKDRAELIKKLHCNSENETWLDTAGDTELKAINCVSWYSAFAFCIWDGARLPTEAEWDYAAVGGEEDRSYPWGENRDVDTANWLCEYEVPGNSCWLRDVGSKSPNSDGRWGHRDLAGSVSEWVYDYYSDFTSEPCDNCCAVSPDGSKDGTYRVTRGTCFADGTYPTVMRWARPSDWTSYSTGFRCARSAQ